MGFFDSLFGGGKKQEALGTKAPEAKVPVALAVGLTPEVTAAISAGVITLMETANAELAAAITAAIAHAGSGGMAVRFERVTEAWVTAGRQKIMDGRQHSGLQTITNKNRG